MSRFLSPRYLRYRQFAASSQTIDRDLSCASCGYNLRGLRYGRNCPECGSLIELARASPDLLLSCDDAAKGRWRWGLRLAALAVVAGIALELVTLGMFIIPPGLGPPAAVGFAAALNLLVWFIAALLVTPRLVNTLGSWVAPTRHAARLLSGLWLASSVYLLLARPAGGMLAMTIFCLFLGGFGALLVLYLLMHVARAADLERAEHRLSNALWLLPVSSFLASFLPLIPWAGLLAVSIVLVIPLLVLIAWVWSMTMVLLALLEMLNHLQWSEIHRERASQRDARISGLRATLDAQAQAAIRPLPKPAAGESTLDE